MRFKQDMFFDLNVLDQNVMVRLTTSDQEHKRLADYGDCDIYMHLTTKEEKINSIIFEQFQIIYDFLNDRKQSGKKKDRPYKIKITTPEPESVSLYLRRSNSTKDLPINFLIELIDRLLDYLDYELDVNKQDDISENYKKQNQDEEEQLNVYNGQVSHSLPLNEEQSNENFEYRDKYFNQNRDFKENYNDDEEDNEDEENPFLDNKEDDENEEKNPFLNNNNEDNNKDFKEKDNNHYEYEEDEEVIQMDEGLDLNKIENLSDDNLDEKQIKEDINSIQKRFDNEVFTSIKEDYQDVDLNNNIEIPLFDPDGNNFYAEKTVEYEENNEEDEEENIFANVTNTQNKSNDHIEENSEDEEDNIFTNTTKVKDELEKNKTKINKTEEDEDEEEFWNQSQK